MSLAELLPAARALDSRDKALLFRALADDLARELATVPPPRDFLGYSPLEAYETAAQLQKLLQDSREAS